MDPLAEMFLFGTEIDHKDTLLESGFVFRNSYGELFLTAQHPPLYSAVLGLAALAHLPDDVHLHLRIVSAAMGGLTVALVGNPNAGKSTLFNALSGLRQRVGNYPGVTVEIETGGATSELQRQYLSTVLTAKDSAIDIYMIDIVNPAQYFGAGWLEPLDTYVGPAATALKPYLPVYASANVVDGKVAALPSPKRLCPCSLPREKRTSSTGAKSIWSSAASGGS